MCLCGAHLGARFLAVNRRASSCRVCRSFKMNAMQRRLATRGVRRSCLVVQASKIHRNAKCPGITPLLQEGASAAAPRSCTHAPTRSAPVAVPSRTHPVSCRHRLSIASHHLSPKASAPPAECLGTHNCTALWQTLLTNDAHTMHDHATKTHATLQHDEHSPQKKATLTSNIGALRHGKRSQHQQKPALTKVNGAHLIKWLAAFCVLDCVGAAAEPWAAELAAMEERHAAELRKVRQEARQEARQELQAVRHEFYQQLQDVRECSGCMSPSPPPPSPSPPPPSPSPPPPSNLRVYMEARGKWSPRLSWAATTTGPLDIAPCYDPSCYDRRLGQIVTAGSRDTTAWTAMENFRLLRTLRCTRRTRPCSSREPRARRLESALRILIAGTCTSALNQAQIHEIDPSDGPCGSGGRYQPTRHMSGVYTPSGGR